MMKKEDHLTQIGPGLGFNQSFFKFQPVSKVFFLKFRISIKFQIWRKKIE